MDHPPQTHQVYQQYQSQTSNHPQKTKQQPQKKIINYQQQKQMNVNMKESSQTLQKFKENQNEVQDQLNQLMMKYASQPHKQQQKNEIVVSMTKNKDQHNAQQMIKHVKNKSQRAQNYNEKQPELQLRMSCLGPINDTEAEDYDNLDQYANDYLYEENDMPLPIAYQQKQTQQSSFGSQQHDKHYFQPQLSKSPIPIMFNSNTVGTPTSLLDIKTSQQNPIQILSHYNLQQNHRNPSQPLSLGFLSHNIPSSDNQTLIREKKKSISTATSNSTNGTFTNTTVSNVNKRASNHNGDKAQTQAHTTNTSKEPHKKSQSLYNKKIVDIISGLQQSLGVIASNVQNSFNNEDNQSKQSQQKALLESALLAQKLAQMTQGLRKDGVKKTLESDKSGMNAVAQNKRKSMKITSNLTGRGSLNIVQKHKSGFKTLEDTQLEAKKQINQSNRMSIDFQQPVRKNCSKTAHQRNRSDLQHPRKNTAQTMNHPQQIAHGYHTKQNTLLTCSNSSIEANQLNSQHNINQFISEEMLIIQNGSNGIPSSAKSLNRINQVLNKQGSLQSSQNNTRISKKNEMCTSIDNTILSEALAAKYRSAMTNPLTSGQSSMITNTIDYPRQSLGQKSQNQRQNNTQISSGERLLEGAYIHKAIKKIPTLVISNDGKHQYDNKLKSAASSPTLHGQNNLPVNNMKKKSHQTSQSNTVFDFTQYQSQLNTAALQEKAKPINQKKKNLVIAQKKDVNTTKSEQVMSHKRSTSDGSSLTKMFHFKQQMLINKIFQQQNCKDTAVVNTNTVSNIVPKKQRTSLSKNQGDSKLQKKSKVQVISSLSSKRMSNEENQENILSNINYHSPRSQNQMLKNNPHLAQNLDVKVSQDMKAFLQKFQDKTNLYQTGVVDTQQQKQLLIHAITQQQQNQVMMKQSQDEVLYVTHKTTTNSNYKQATQITTQKDQYENSNYQTEQVNKRQSMQVQKACQVIQSHKRAKSDAQKQCQLQQSQQMRAQHIMNQANQTKQKMFFLNLNQQQQLNKDFSKQNPKLNENYQLLYGSQASNFIYSARASPSNQKNNYYNFDESQKQIGSTNTKPFMPTARSETQTKIKNTMSNQTTQKKNNYQNNNNRLVESVNTKLVYNDQHLDQMMVQAKYGTNILQSQQFSKLASILYGDTNQANNVKNKIGGTTTIYSTGDNNESMVYTLMKEEQSLNKQLIGSEKSFRQLGIQSLNQSPKLKVLSTPKIAQPGGFQISAFNDDILEHQQQNTYQSNFMIAPQHVNQNIAKEFEGNQFQTFESNLTTHTINNLTPRSKDKHRIMKQIKLSFNKLKEPIKTTSEFYRIGKMLGKGAFGRVNLAIHKLCNQLVAVKSINKQYLSEDESSKKKMMQEVLILQKTRHDNLVRLYDSFETNKHIVFVMELCAGGDLLNYVRKRRKLKENVAKYVFKQVVDGLNYCHQKGIIHRDMKLDNLLLDEQGVVKICDFGVSKLLSSPSEIMTEQCGTPAYIAPEILKDKGYKGFGVDIWSLGVCLYAMLFGTVPFKANNMSELHQLIMKAKYTIKDETKPGEQPLSEDVKNLVKLLLEPNPDKRIGIDGILKHKWLLDTDDQSDIEIFTEQELETIRKDFTYQDMSRYKRNHHQKMKIEKQNQDNENENGICLTTEENLFTEHALDSTQNVLMRNCTTKSVVLAPFNSTRTHIAREDLDSNDQDQDQEDNTWIPPLPIDQAMMVDKRIIKYAPRVKDINRQYEMNNNCELDNGVYNKFIKQSTEGDNKSDDQANKTQNSLVTSMNNENQMNDQNQYAAPLVSQNSDEEVEAELIKKNQLQCHSELQQMQTFLQQQKTEFKQVPDEPILIGKYLKYLSFYIDYEVVERVENFGYPRQFIIESLETYEMNDAATNYYLLDKEKIQIEDYQGYFQ